MTVAAQNPSPEFAPFAEYLRRGELRFPRCVTCGQFHWYPMKRCPHCQSLDIKWQPVSAQGSLYSWTVVRRAFAEDTPPPPYIVALVEFVDAPGIRFVTNLIDTPPSDIRIGMSLVAKFQVDQGKVDFKINPTA